MPRRFRAEILRARTEITITEIRISLERATERASLRWRLISADLPRM